MSFETAMRACADHEDERQMEAEAMQREEKRLAVLAVLEARIGNIAKLWSATDYDSNDAVVIRALLECAHEKHPAAIAAIKQLAQTYAANNAEVNQ